MTTAGAGGGVIAAGTAGDVVATGAGASGAPGGAPLGRVTGLAVTPVKGMRLLGVERIDLDPSGARGDRRFFVVDERCRMVNGKVVGELQTVIAQCADGQLRLTFADGTEVESTLEFSETVTARFFSRSVEGRLLDGACSDALSEQLGRPLRIVEAEGSIDRGPIGAASLISRASLARLAGVAERPSIDVRRFRMLIEIDGVASHEEDQWVGRAVHVGGATVRWRGNVGRCLITSRDPESGQIDLPTLDLLGGYRAEVEATEPLPFGIYGEVLRPGSVRVGDELTLA